MAEYEKKVRQVLLDNYIFLCVFIYEDDGISIFFPDLDGCVSFGENERQAFYNAKEALTLHLYGMEQDNDPIPDPSAIKSISLDDNEQAVLIEAYMPAFRAKQVMSKVNSEVNL